MGGGELRSKLRPIFDKFDADGSGAVSLSEMSTIIAHLGMEVTSAQLRILMEEADPDRSGEIDFDEVLPPPPLAPPCHGSKTAARPQRPDP